MAQRHAAGGAGADVAEHIADRHADGLDGCVAIAAFGDMPAQRLGIPVFDTPNSQTLPSWTVMIWVASVAHIMFGASVMIFRSCGVVSRGRERCGDSRPFSRISRSTRLRATRMPSITRSLAHTLRCPSPCQGERARSARIAASRASSETAGFGPRDPPELVLLERRPDAGQHRRTTAAPPRSADLGDAVAAAGARGCYRRHHRDLLRAKGTGRSMRERSSLHINCRYRAVHPI